MKDTQLLLANQICFPIYSASRMITKAYKPHLDELGLTYPQYLVLLILWEQDNLTVSQISEKLFLNSNTLSPMFKRMEKTGLLQRIRNVEDERSVTIKLTEKGKLLKNKAVTIPEKLIDDIVTDQISFDDMLTLKNTLCELIKGIQVKN